MNKLFLFVFIPTFIISQSDFYLFSLIGIVALFFIVPLTTPETIGQKKNKK